MFCKKRWGDEGRAMKADVTNLINRSRPDAKAKGNQGTPLISHLLVYNAKAKRHSFFHFIPPFLIFLSRSLSTSHFSTSQTTNKWRSSSPMIRSLSSRKPSAYLTRMATVCYVFPYVTVLLLICIFNGVSP